MGDLDQLVPSSPWPSRRAVVQFARRGTLVLLALALLNVGVRAIPRERVEALLSRRPRIVPAAGSWPTPPVQVRTLAVRALPFGAGRFAALARAVGLGDAPVTPLPTGWRADADGARLIATRGIDVWVVTLSGRTPAQPGPPPAGGAEQVVRDVLAAVGMDPEAWDLPPRRGDRPERRVLGAAPRHSLPVDTSVGALLTQFVVSGDRVDRLLLPVVAFQPGEYADVAPVPDVLGRLRWRLVPARGRRLPVHDPRLVLLLPPGLPAQDGAVLQPAWALDTRRPDYGVLFAPATE